MRKECRGQEKRDCVNSSRGDLLPKSWIGSSTSILGSCLMLTYLLTRSGPSPTRSCVSPLRG